MPQSWDMGQIILLPLRRKAVGITDFVSPVCLCTVDMFHTRDWIVFRLLSSEERRVCKASWTGDRDGTVPRYRCWQRAVHNHKQSRLATKCAHKIWWGCQFLPKRSIRKLPLQSQQPLKAGHAHCQGSGPLNMQWTFHNEITRQCWYKHREFWICIRQVQWQRILPNIRGLLL
jgi:hypothetical protein